MRADAEALYNANQRGLFRYFCQGRRPRRDGARSDAGRLRAGQPQRHPSRAGSGAQGLAVPDRQEPGPRPSPQRPAATAGRAADRYAARPASQDTSAEVNEALASLADVDRDVFLMREVAGLGYDEIATACGLTPDAVRSRIHRARLQLRERLSTPDCSAARNADAAVGQSSDSKRTTLDSHSHDRHTRRHFSFSGRRTLRCRGARRGAERSRRGAPC